VNDYEEAAMSDETPLSEEIAALERTGWVPQTTAEDGAPTASKFSGTPWLTADAPWPVCPNCEQPMQLFAQINLADVPEPERERLGGEGLLQLFYCTSYDPLCEVDCEAFFPFADSVVARRLPTPADGDTPAEGAGPADPFPARRIAAWEAVTDYPNIEELQWEMGIDVSDQEMEYLDGIGSPAAGDKLGGWPHWIQGVEYPSCPECGATMQLVLQIDSECNLPYMFGDVGAGHLTQCPDHPDVLAFGWACC